MKCAPEFAADADTVKPDIDMLRRVLTSRAHEVAIESPLEMARLLSERTGNRVFLKREDMQPVFSFKLRGAYNRMVGMTGPERRRGVIAASAGNHAQGVALAAARLNMSAAIVMPVTAPRLKVDAVRRLGGENVEVVLAGDSFSDAYAAAMLIEAEKNLVFVHPFDDPDVIAGQATVGLEVLRQLDCRPDIIFVPVGGGGLLAGIACYVKAVSPSTLVFGVQAEDSDAMARSIEQGTRVYLDEVGLFADGTAVKQVGQLTFELCRRHCDGIVRVGGDALCAAIRDVYQETRSVPEPAGALAVAGLKQFVADHAVQGANVVAIVSGANMNFERLRFVAERAEAGENREALFAVTIPEERGSFRRFCASLGRNSITEFNYRIGDARQAHIFVGIETESSEERSRLSDSFRQNGFPVLDLSDDELAKLHLRHMVGGRSHLALNERLYSFEFPERPGALPEFLNRLHPNWNISLFHYRNHGADHGRILVGIQVPDDELPAFDRFLSDIQYPYADQSDNAAYKLLLSA